ncbi:hypothetical protein GCM10007937_58250 [Mesorhizobium albiziae]|nr:hypothetical protein GCM10007937_58250 [Mesorhizobium albiziae]
MGYQVQDIIAAHVKTLAEHPPTQRGTSLSMEAQIEQLTKSKQ